MDRWRRAGDIDGRKSKRHHVGRPRADGVSAACTAEVARLQRELADTRAQLGRSCATARVPSRPAASPSSRLRGRSRVGRHWRPDTYILGARRGHVVVEDFNLSAIIASSPGSQWQKSARSYSKGRRFKPTRDI